MATTRTRNNDTAGEKRQRILDAAVQAFGSHGYYRTRISDIAKAANVADGTVYLYFDSKDRILSTIFADLMTRALTIGRREVEKLDGALPRLRRVVELHLDNLGRNRNLATIFQIELRHSSRFMEAYSRTYLRDYFQLIADILEQGQRESVVRSDLDVWFATKCIFGILDEAATNWVLSEKNYRLRSVTGPIMEFVSRGIGPG